MSIGVGFVLKKWRGQWQQLALDHRTRTEHTRSKSSGDLSLPASFLDLRLPGAVPPSSGRAYEAKV
jgi:hypothetical protein